MRILFTSVAQTLVFALSSTLVAEAFPSPLNMARAPHGHSLSRRATVCNGHAELCEKSFGNVTFVGAHDSYAVGVNNLATNQDQNITQQLNDGIRMLQSQVHFSNNAIHLCHTSCSLYDGGLLEDYLKTVKSWLDANPNEVLSLLIVNSDNRNASEFDTIFKAAGLDTMSYSPTASPLTTSEWPTLGAMIDAGTRLVTFLDNGADPSIPYLVDEFTNVWETAFDVTDTTFDCEVNRTKGDTSTQMYLINHFLDKIVFNQPVPFVEQANVTNAVTGVGSLGVQVGTCVTDHGRPPNFMLVDFYEYGGGSVFEVAATINGVQYSPATPVASPVSTSSSTTTTGSSQTGSGAPSMFGVPSSSQLVACLTVIGGVMLGPCLVL